MDTIRALSGLLFLTMLGAAQTPDEININGLRNSHPFATFDHGYVAAWDLLARHSVTIYGPDGRQMVEVSSVELPDGTRTKEPLRVAIDSDGTSAIAYWVNPPTRAGIGILDSRGKQLRVIETQPYEPAQVCFAPDHSIWMRGLVRGRGDAPAPDYVAFRHYGRDGKLLGSFVPRSQLPRWEGQGVEGVLDADGHWELRTAKDRFGGVVDLGSDREAWVELDFTGKLIGQWTYTNTGRDSVSPVAFDSEGVLYARHYIDHKLVGISILDKATSTWKPVNSLPNGHLIGADGTRLVYQDGDKVSWLPGLSTVLVESAEAKP